MREITFSVFFFIIFTEKYFAEICFLALLF